MRVEGTGSRFTMTRDSTNQALRQIQALYALGPLGGLSDAELIERFLDRRGADAEDAFASLVQRHGPMVLGVCRRMLAGSSDADDAFQAVFLVLARRAGAIRRVEGLKSWLYGVSVRTAKEARRRAARRRAREGGVIDVSRVVSATDERWAEQVTLLDEEIDRLPSRYREPLMLCDLGGTSRQDAALRLKLREGTLSSRLARGRSLLRERLARRGVTLGVGGLSALVADPAAASLSESLVTSTARLAFSFTTKAAAAGVVPVAVASLAEGVLMMIAHAKLKMALATVALGMVGLTLAWAVGPSPDKPKGSPPVAKVKKSGDSEPSEPGRMEVRLEAFDENGRPIGGANAPARAIPKPSRAVTVRVVDPSKTPIAGASVAVCGYSGVRRVEALTGPDGSARLVIRGDATILWVVALKSKLGLDYAEYGPLNKYGGNQGVSATELPAMISLTLDGARTARIKAVDRTGKPLAGIGFSPSLLQKPGRRRPLYIEGGIFTATTGPDGVATFDWLPPNHDEFQFSPHAEGYVCRPVIVKEGATEAVTIRLVPLETIRGRVVHPDGSPAKGSLVQAFGTGDVSAHDQESAGTAHAGTVVANLDSGMPPQDSAWTAHDGTYEIPVRPGEAYAVIADNRDWGASPGEARWFSSDKIRDWVAPSRLDVVVREGQPVSGVDFKLARATLLHGTVTMGPGNRPVRKQSIGLIQSGIEIPEDLRNPGDRSPRKLQLQRQTTTSEFGGYQFRLGPGTYSVIDPSGMKDETITIKDEVELIRDFKLPGPDKGPLSGRVVLAGTKDKGVAGAQVELRSFGHGVELHFVVIADQEGRFQTDPETDKCYLSVKSPDGSLGALAELAAGTKEVVIAVSPTASASGVLLDVDGQPAANEELTWDRGITIGENGQISMSNTTPRMNTDAKGRFTLRGLIVGQGYPVCIERGRGFQLACLVRPEAPGPIDLGPIQPGHYKPGASGQAKLTPEEMSSFSATLTAFNKNAPDLGEPAPPFEATTLDGKPVSLNDFKGKYVLLNFWAAWCSDCIAEIPQIQAVQDAFGNDKRFAILNLSIDKRIDEPKAFQEERKLAWSQAFLGGGVESATPRAFGVRGIPAYMLVGPDGKVVARGMRGDDLMKEVAKALANKP